MAVKNVSQKFCLLIKSNSTFLKQVISSMLHKTSGIVLHCQKYSDTSLIVKLYTKDFGLQSYLINGTRSKKSKTKASLFQPLSIIDLEVTHSEKGELQRMTEVNNSSPYQTIPYQIVKSSILLFVNEILYKSLKESHSDAELFEFIKNSLLLLDIENRNCSNFHLYFMLRLTKHLGFYPQGEYIHNNSIFDLKEGVFKNSVPEHPFYLSISRSNQLYTFICGSFETINTIKLNKLERKQLIESLILFYQFHIIGFGEVKSIAILEEVIS